MGLDAVEHTRHSITQGGLYFTDFICGVSKRRADKKEYTFSAQSLNFLC
jgi:hypothetical protein